MPESSAFTSANALSMAGLALLVLEDEPHTRLLLADALGFVGAIVTLSSTCRETLEQLKEQHFDVILANIVLPDGSGYTMLQTWRQWEQAHNLTMTPAVAVTAAVTTVNRAKAVVSGFQSFISKPYDFEQLFSAVATAHDDQRLTAANAVVKL